MEIPQTGFTAKVFPWSFRWRGAELAREIVLISSSKSPAELLVFDACMLCPGTGPGVQLTRVSMWTACLFAFEFGGESAIKCSHRNIRRRAHHLPPGPNIFRPQTQHLKSQPFSKFGKSSWVGWGVLGDLGGPGRGGGGGGGEGGR